MLVAGHPSCFHRKPYARYSVVSQCRTLCPTRFTRAVVLTPARIFNSPSVSHGLLKKLWKLRRYYRGRGGGVVQRSPRRGLWFGCGARKGSLHIYASRSTAIAPRSNSNESRGNRPPFRSVLGVHDLTQFCLGFSVSSNAHTIWPLECLMRRS